MLRFLAAILLGVSAFGATSNPEIRLAPARRSAVIVEFQAARPRAATLEQFRRDVATLDQRAGKRALTPIRYEYRHAIFGAAVEAPPTTIDALRRLPYVRAVHPDRTVTMYAASKATPAAAAIDAAARVNAGSLPTRGEGITVAVLDTGIDYNHSALGGGFGAGHKVAGGWDFVNQDADPLDDNGHGTHVAGIIAADSAELAGVAPAATLIAYKVLDFQGRGSQSDVIAAIERSIDPNQDGNPSDHLDVINLSLGGPGTADDLVSLAVDNASAAGVTVVVAAGNEGVVGSIGSPGTARTAITVGAIGNNGIATSFSSRGPSPATLLFKPDVLAPGILIPSSYLGGGLATFNGTSMAAPHVAGAAALLRKLHPEWTPADIKSALVTTTIATPGSPVARAAGRIDAAHAAIATSFVDNTGLSFGLDFGKGGSFEATRTVALTNRATVERTFDVVATNVPAGAILSAKPATLQLAPGATKSVELRFAADNTVLPFPQDAVLGGDVEFQGAAPFALPWILMRGARITVAYDSGAENILALSNDGARSLYRYDPGKAELFAQPDTVWDVIAAAYDFGDQGVSALRFAIAENRTASGDVEVALHRDDANLEVNFNGRDKNGTPFRELPVEGDPASSLSIRVLYGRNPDVAVAYHFLAVPKLLVSPVSANFTFHPFEAYWDFTNKRVYNVQHQALSGITESKMLTTGGTSLKGVRLRFPPNNAGPNAMITCANNGVRTASALVQGIGQCFVGGFEQAIVIDYYTTMESGAGVSGIDFDTGITGIPKLRGIDNAIVPVIYSTASPAAYRIADGEDITLGTAPLHPFLFYGTVPQQYLGLPPGFKGLLGESYRGTTTGTTWTMFDSANAQKSSGFLESAEPFEPAPVAQPGDHFVAVRDEMNVAGRSSRGELEVRFGSEPGDLIAPTLTTLRVVNALGRVADRFDRGSVATVQFSAADLDYPSGTTRQLKLGSTRVWYRLTGTTEWISVFAVTNGTDLGTLAALGHFPAGEIFRADLPLPAQTDGSVDVRIEIEDLAGNRTTWIQSPAIIVGEVTAPAPKKRRAVR